jgi:hypothetical protein
MKHKLLSAATVLLALGASVGSGAAFPSTPIHVSQALASIQRVTFWGDAFPYGYSWSVVRACTRYEPVETAQGTQMQRVWVCGEKSRRER